MFKLITNIKTVYKIYSFILLISLVLSQPPYTINLDNEDCSKAPANPENEEQCTSYNTEDTACCYVEIENIDRSIESKCVAVKKDARFALNHLTIFSLKDSDTSDGSSYTDVIGRFKCGQEDRLCGMDVPDEIFQCSEHSSTTRSCCYLETPTYTECILSDQKYDKETTFVLFEESTVYCNNEFFGFNLLILISSIIFLI